MEIKATQKFLIMSPKKIRLVAQVAKKLSPSEAILQLPFIGKKASGPLCKVIKSALANARNKGFSEADLIFKEIQIGEGPRLKRGRPISRGQWHPIKKRMAHIRVILQTVNNLPSTAQKEKTQKKAVANSQKAIDTTERSKHGTKN